MFALRSLKTATILASVVLMPFTMAFQIPHAGHHHPIYVRYRQEELNQEHQHQNPHQGHGPLAHSAPQSELVKTQSTAMALSEEDYFTNFAAPTEQALQTATICTPVSYDEETGMVQTAVRAIVQHPLSNLVDSSVVGLSSSLVLATGALHEVLHCVELEWTHHASAGSTESLAILSLGHFLHYGREGLRQLKEKHEEEQEQRKESES